MALLQVFPAVPLHVCLCVLTAAVMLRSTSCHSTPAHRLDRALHHFETLHADSLRHKVFSTHAMTHSHWKRSTALHHYYPRELHFTTLGRDFHLILEPRKHLFHQFAAATIIEDGQARPYPIPYDQFFEGTVSDEPGSQVTAHLHHPTGVLTATINTQDERYFVEPSFRHFREPHDFHMITYRASDVKYNLTGSPTAHFCGNPEHRASEIPGGSVKPSRGEDQRQGETQFSKGGGGGGGRDGAGLDGGRDRLRRAPLPSGDSCSIHLVATHQFHREYSIRNNREDSIFFMLQVIDSVDQIFRRTAFSTSSGGRIGLLVSNITVYTTESNDPGYNRNRIWSSGDLLTSFAMRENHNPDECLAHLFTAITLSDGRLGIAYIANEDVAVAGGICSPDYMEDGQLITANAGVSSLFSDGRPLLLAEAQLVTAHEIGHNWGSEHDPTGSVNECNPDRGGGAGEGGKFLMFPSATDGSQRNNDDFSSCSMLMMSSVLQEKANCFSDMSEQLCGNYIIEEMEECDAGVAGSIDSDPCCTSDCRLKPNSDCSDVNHECCENCQVSSSNQTCRMYEEGNINCFANRNCDGESMICPSGDTYVNVNETCGLNGQCKPLDTTCSTSMVCQSSTAYSPGDRLQCLGFCALRGLESCFCTGDEECFHCCLSADSATNQTVCQPFGEDDNQLPDGSTCIGGTCVDGNCEPASRDLVTRLFDVFSDFSINALWLLVRENIVGSVLIFSAMFWVPIGLLIHFCIDRRIWEDLQETAIKWEKEREKAFAETEHDLSIAEKSPDIITPIGKKALVRLASQNESIAGEDFFGSDDPSYWSQGEGGFAATRSVRTLERGKSNLEAIPEGSPPDVDPERYNIWTHMSAQKDYGTSFQS